MHTDSPLWVIAGSDCSAGAGIQADIKTFHSLGVDCRSVITAVTAQNSYGVQQINAVSDSALIGQLQALEADGRARIIKIGLLANSRQVEQVAQRLAQYKNQWQVPPQVIYDPVAIASSGGALTEDDILPAIRDKLLPWVDILTPNIMEAEILTEIKITSWHDLQVAAQDIVGRGCHAVIIKGGHLDFINQRQPQHCVDYCFDGQQHYWLASPKMLSRQTHGSGCTYASALAALLAQDYLLRDAATIAKAYVNQGIAVAEQAQPDNRALCQGGWPCNPEHYPRVLVADSELAHDLDWKTTDNLCSAYRFDCDFAPLLPDSVGLYPVVDSLAWLQRLLKMGVTTIQYRQKQLQGDALCDAIEQAVALGNQYNARVFINDYWQLAIQHRAYGVHLGQEDIHSADLQHIKRAGLRLGISTHGHYEYLKMLEYRPSYLAIGAIFPTVTKDMSGQIQGIKTLANIMQLNSAIPTVAIGGITLQRAEAVLNTGVSGIAVVTAITRANNPESAVAQFQHIFQQRAAI
ncbi:thiamine phosphate synthase [Neptunicella sp. SCSIO 80796]|uniref:thiamine phosphate synthase n=1 Tax=Neptunicella plasticusilytica TaxID=3117012 RepID=UPI003A4D2BEA